MPAGAAVSYTHLARKAAWAVKLSSTADPATQRKRGTGLLERIRASPIKKAAGSRIAAGGRMTAKSCAVKKDRPKNASGRFILSE